MARDHNDIVAVLVRYARLIDQGDLHLVADAIFATDARVDYGTGPVEGRDAIHAFFTQVPALDGTAHYLSNFDVAIDGDHATSSCYYQSWHWFRATADFGPLRPADFIGVGRYEDELVRTAGGWRIARRRLHPLGPGAIGVGRPPQALVAMYERRAREQHSDPAR